MASIARAAIPLIVVVTLVGCASGNGPIDQTSQVSVELQFAATDLEGYWRCAEDGSVTHITNVEMPGGGAGSFTPPDGRMIPDGLFRSVHFLGDNRWEAMMNERARPGFVAGEDDPLSWRRVVIEMENRHAFRVGRTLFRRQ